MHLTEEMPFIPFDSTNKYLITQGIANRTNQTTAVPFRLELNTQLCIFTSRCPNLNSVNLTSTTVHLFMY